MTNFSLELAQQEVRRFLNAIGWTNMPDYRIVQKTDGKLVLGSYVLESQFDGEAIIEVDLKAIAKFDVTDPQLCLKVTILHELAHMAHEAASDEPDYPAFAEYFSDEEDMCEWFGWNVTHDAYLTAQHPFFSKWIDAVDSYYSLYL